MKFKLLYNFLLLFFITASNVVIGMDQNLLPKQIKSKIRMLIGIRYEVLELINQLKVNYNPSLNRPELTDVFEYKKDYFGYCPFDIKNPNIQNTQNISNISTINLVPDISGFSKAINGQSDFRAPTNYQMNFGHLQNYTRPRPPLVGMNEKQNINEIFSEYAVNTTNLKYLGTQDEMVENHIINEQSFFEKATIVLRTPALRLKPKWATTKVYKFLNNRDLNFPSEDLIAEIERLESEIIPEELLIYLEHWMEILDEYQFCLGKFHEFLLHLFNRKAQI